MIGTGLGTLTVNTERKDTHMNMDRETYGRYVKARAPSSPLLKDALFAFFIGGTVCAIAQGLLLLYRDVLSIPEKDAATLTSVTVVFIAVTLTALGLFDKIASHAGCGTLVPITGFANAVTSPAIDSRAEGLVLGIGAKIFSVAGPVLLYGVLSGAVYGVIYWVTTLF